MMRDDQGGQEATEKMIFINWHIFFSSVMLWQFIIKLIYLRLVFGNIHLLNKFSVHH